MKEDLIIQDNITIPDHELEISASRSGGAGGQHVNKTSTRITLRWNIPRSQALSEYQKKQILEKLASEVTTEGDIIVHNSSTRSQLQNKQNAKEILAQKIRNALYVPKKRKKTKISKKAQEARLQSKKKKSIIKRMRSKKIDYD